MVNRLWTMNIYKAKGRGNFSNGGISSRFDEVLVVDGFAEDAPENAVVLIERPSFGDVIAVPARRQPGMVGPMFGGSFAYTSNGIVPHHGKAIPLHDRFETTKQNDMLSQ